mgnify:CR=1 FL=1
MPLPEDKTFDALEDLFRQVFNLYYLLQNPEVSSVRLVLNPEKMVIKETEKAYTYLHLFGFPVDGIFINKVVGKEHPMYEIQQKYIKRIEKSMKVLSRGRTDYEFRTTIVPVYKPVSLYEKSNTEKNFFWFSSKWAEDMARWIVKTTENNEHKHYLQTFVAKTKEEMVGEVFSKEKIPEAYRKTPKHILERLQQVIKKYLPKCKIRE